MNRPLGSPLSLAVFLSLWLAAPPQAVSTPITPGQGVTFSQVDLNFAASSWFNSGYGLVSIDSLALTTAAGIGGGYLNVSTNEGWVIQNLPIEPALSDLDGMSSFFILGGSGDVTGLTASIDFSAEPIATFDSPPSSSNFNVGNVEMMYGGVGQPVNVSPNHPLPNWHAAPGGGLPNERIYQGRRTNIEQDLNQCATAAMANSLNWLRERHPELAQHYMQPHAPGLAGDNTLVGNLDDHAFRGQGETMSAVGAIDAKLRFMNQHNLGQKLNFKGFGFGQDVNEHGQVFDDQTPPGINQTNPVAFTTALLAWLKQEMAAGEDVEVFVVWGQEPDLKAHAVDLVGIGQTLGIPWIKFIHDANQRNNGAGTGIDGGHLHTPIRPDGTIRFPLNGIDQVGRLYWGFSESYIPEPATASLLALGWVALWHRRLDRRRKAPRS